MPERHETVTCGGFAATPCLLPQKEVGPFAERMVEDILFRRNKALPHQKSLSSVILAADIYLCGGSLLAHFLQSLP